MNDSNEISFHWKYSRCLRGFWNLYSISMTRSTYAKHPKFYVQYWQDRNGAETPPWQWALRHAIRQCSLDPCSLISNKLSLHQWQFPDDVVGAEMSCTVLKLFLSFLLTEHLTWSGGRKRKIEKLWHFSKVQFSFHSTRTRNSRRGRCEDISAWSRSLQHGQTGPGRRPLPPGPAQRPLLRPRAPEGDLSGEQWGGHSQLQGLQHREQDGQSVSILGLSFIYYCSLSFPQIFKYLQILNLNLESLYCCFIWIVGLYTKCEMSIIAAIQSVRSAAKQKNLSFSIFQFPWFVMSGFLDQTLGSQVTHRGSVYLHHRPQASLLHSHWSRASECGNIFMLLLGN